MKILLTGSTGFVGGALAYKLAKAHEVVCPERTDIDLINSPIELDMAVKKNNTQLIIHLAHPRMWHFLNAMSESILMMKNVLDVCRLNDIPLLYTSSLAVFSGYHDLERIPHNLSPLPEKTYDQTKYLCEQLAESYRKVYDTEIAILRPSYLYGPGMDRSRFIFKSIIKAMKQEPLIVHKYLNGYQFLDYLHIDDLIRAIFLSITKMPKETVNIGSGVGTSTLQVTEMIKQLVNSSSKIEVVDIDAKVSNLVVNSSVAIELLGWRAEKGLIDGLTDLIAKEQSK